MLIMALVLLQTAMAHAQNEIEKVFADYCSNAYVVVASSSSHNANMSDGSVSYCRFTEFTFPKEKKGTALIKGMERAINVDRSKAYDVFIRKPDSKIGKQQRFYDYGANNEYSVKLGTYDIHNYYGLCFAEPNDSLRRHAYCFVWYAEGSKYHCFFYHIYGVRPSEFAAYKSGRNIRIKDGGKVSTRVYSDGSVVMTQSYDDHGNMVSATTSPQQYTTEVKNDLDFMLQFGNLRAAFLDAVKDAEAKTLQAGLVVKIVRLCKEKGKLLSDNEKKTCVDSIADMNKAVRSTNSDNFLSGMLQEARNALMK